MISILFKATIHNQHGSNFNILNNMEITITGKIVALSIVAVGIALPTFLLVFHCCFLCFSSKRRSTLNENEEETIFDPLSKIDENSKENDLPVVDVDKDVNIK